jgi:NADPH-dependent curcumin reductase CurA
VVVKTLALSLDPAMRGWMNDGKSYIPPVGIGEVMRAGGVGVVVASDSPAFAVGSTVSGGWACRNTAPSPASSCARAACRASTCAWAR